MNKCGRRLSSALTISSLDLIKLPALKFPNRVVMVNSLEEDKNVQRFFHQPPGMIVGFDSEAKPSFGLPPNKKNRTAIIQVATPNLSCIWRVIGMSSVPPTLAAILENKDVTKVAQGATHERQTLYQEFGIVGEGFVDLHEIALAHRCQPRSLQGLVGIFLERKLRKEERCSNWERMPLSVEQVDYAATDAYAALMVLLAMRKKLGDGPTVPLPAERILAGSLTATKSADVQHFLVLAPAQMCVLAIENRVYLQAPLPPQKPLTTWSHGRRLCRKVLL
eukprot:GEMP01052059.1.p1 GENE.GEMP01052059.1~~GEMP01052059.1.p1  ORF type:complete len:278 (+),score=52.62 GEMP01052059.1:115-948(+)